MNKYLDTLIKLSELPPTNWVVHKGYCKITNPYKMQDRPCNQTDTLCHECIYGKPVVNNEQFKIREYIDTVNRTT